MGATRLAVLLGVVAGMAAAPARADFIWGVNGHPFTAYPGVTPEQQLDYLRDLGITSYRVNISDAGPIDRLAALVRAAKARGIAILPVITPALDLDKASPETLYRKARALAVTLVSRFKDDIRVWELGNEMENYAILQPCERRDDGTRYPCDWGPAGGVGALDYYGPRWAKVSAVLKGLAEGVMAVDPAIRKAMGTAGWGHVGAFERMAQDGISWDISVWHMYGEDPEWAFKRLAAFERPIWVTEFNHPRGSEDGERAQAEGLKRWMARLLELRRAYRVEAAHIYELLDETYWAPSFEAVMGLVRLEKDGRGSWRTGAAKPAYHAVRAMIRSGSAGPVVQRSCDLRAFDSRDSSHGHQVAYAFCLILGRAADGGGLEGWTESRRQGTSVPQMLEDMVGSDEFNAKYATSRLDNGGFVVLIHRLLLGRDPGRRRLARDRGRLDRGTLSRRAFARAVIDSETFRSTQPILFRDGSAPAE